MAFAQYIYIEPSEARAGDETYTSNGWQAILPNAPFNSLAPVRRKVADPVVNVHVFESRDPKEVVKFIKNNPDYVFEAIKKGFGKVAAGLGEAAELVNETVEACVKMGDALNEAVETRVNEEMIKRELNVPVPPICRALVREIVEKDMALESSRRQAEIYRQETHRWASAYKEAEAARKNLQSGLDYKGPLTSEVIGFRGHLIYGNKSAVDAIREFCREFDVLTDEKKKIHWPEHKIAIELSDTLHGMAYADSEQTIETIRELQNNVANQRWLSENNDQLMAINVMISAIKDKPVGDGSVKGVVQWLIEEKDRVDTAMKPIYDRSDCPHGRIESIKWFVEDFLKNEVDFIQVMAGDNAIESLKEQLSTERVMHAACLTLAEGNCLTDEVKDESLAVRKVRELRKNYENVLVARDQAIERLASHDGRVTLTIDSQFIKDALSTSEDWVKILFDALGGDINETAASKGWNQLDNDDRMVSLIHREASEITEALRTGNPPDKHLPKYHSAVVEMADIMIRIIGACRAREWPLAEALLAKMEFNKSRPFKHGNKQY